MGTCCRCDLRVAGPIAGARSACYSCWRPPCWASPPRLDGRNRLAPTRRLDAATTIGNQGLARDIATGGGCGPSAAGKKGPFDARLERRWFGAPTRPWFKRGSMKRRLSCSRSCFGRLGRARSRPAERPRGRRSATPADRADRRPPVPAASFSRHGGRAYGVESFLAARRKRAWAGSGPGGGRRPDCFASGPTAPGSRPSAAGVGRGRLDHDGDAAARPLRGRAEAREASASAARRCAGRVGGGGVARTQRRRALRCARCFAARLARPHPRRRRFGRAATPGLGGVVVPQAGRARSTARRRDAMPSPTAPS